MTAIAVIGAGLSGLVAARELSVNHDVTVFEKSRGVGGRMATRYERDYEFDHGTQFFIARSPAFRAFLEPLLERGIVANWPACFAELERGAVMTTRRWNEQNPHYVGVPRMNSIGKSLARGLDIRLQTSVARLERRHHRWLIIDKDCEEHGLFDWVVITAPAEQTKALLPAHSTINEHCEAARMHGCFALMLGFEGAVPLPWEAALVHGADISWVSVNSSKPGRSGRFCAVVHSTNAWAEEHIDDGLEAISSHMLAEVSEVLGIDAEAADLCSLHRWRYANSDARTGPPCAVDLELKLAACGDWFIRGRVEAAFSSARALLNELSSKL